MIKGAVFDVDGTLLDSMEIWEEVGVRYLKNQGIEPEPGLSKLLFPMTVEEAACYMKENYHLSQSVDQIIEVVLNTVRDFYYYEAPLKHGVEEFLEEMRQRKIPMVIATSSERDHIDAAFQRLGIAHYFERIFTCSEVGVGKSQPLVYQKAAEYLGTKPGDTCVFEDVLHAIQTAKRAGFHTVAVYDRFSDDDQEEIKKTADRYYADLRMAEDFWKEI